MANDDLKYIEQVLAGNSIAFGQLVERYQVFVFSVVSRILTNREEAEEAAQDTFLKAFRRLKTYQQEAKFSTWLYRIAYNTAIDYSRRRKISKTSMDDDETGKFLHLIDENFKGQFEQLQALQRSMYVRKLLQQLPEQENAVMTLFYLREHSVEEIAAMLDLSPANVKVKLHRTRQKLRIHLEQILNNEAQELL